MEIIRPYTEIITPIDPEKIIRHLELVAKNCYKAEHTIGDYSKSQKFIKNIIKRGHHSILEHVIISVRVICDRGVTHEIVRHRLASYAQESTRYCNYSKNGIQCIHPDELTENQRKRREMLYESIEMLYNLEISEGLSPQIARGVLPTALKTEIIMTLNLREWRHFFELRSLGKAGSPHPQIKEIADEILYEFCSRIPVIFDDLVS